MQCSDCGNEIQIGSWPWCPHKRGHGGNRLSAIHTSERSVVYRNPRTGEIRYPARNDQPVPPVYARQGYERHELRSAAEVRAFERSTGRVHEASWYDKGSATAERELAAHMEPPPIKGLDDPTV